MPEIVWAEMIPTQKWHWGFVFGVAHDRLSHSLVLRASLDRKLASQTHVGGEARYGFLVLHRAFADRRCRRNRRSRLWRWVAIRPGKGPGKGMPKSFGAA